jgi:tRNA-2-methylthio-N6-dimethylallyladenosine synthase
VEVLVEERAKNGRWRGRTPQNKLVFFDDPRDRLGRLVPVTLDWTGPFTLIGKAAGS